MRITLLLLTAALGAAAGAPAQTLQLKPGAATPLSRDELRHCMEREDQLKARQRAQEAERAALDREGAELARAAEQLAEDLRRTDTRDFSRVDAYNQRAAAHEQRAAALNTRVQAFNDDVGRLNAEGAGHVAQCATRPFDPADREAILAQRLQAGPAASAASR